ncbi:MAG: glycosyltransferase family 2 protein [Methylacidiphilales bacterium]|nr:glycosyltransferase family 2 protein [Candidatus Methylacidiphilales bacterium]
MRISVVICTHNPREEYLNRVLQALRGQTLPPDQWELLVVDNASKVPVASSFDLSWHPQGRMLKEEKLGKMNAWFKGISEAKGEILIFVDDDTVLDAHYLEKALEVGKEWPFIGAWGGAISAEFETPPPAWCLIQPWRLTIVEVREEVWSNLREGFATVPCGAGLCVRREVCQRYLEWCRTHEMSYALDRIGNLVTGYGDINLVYCSFDLGMGTGQTTRLHLTHLIPASRLTLDYFLRQAEGDALSLMMFRALRGLRLEDPRLSLEQKVKLLLRKAFSKQPPEMLKIYDAHQRGLEKGYRIAQEYLRSGKKDDAHVEAKQHETSFPHPVP